MIKPLTYFLIGFFIIGLIVLYEVSKYDKDIETMLNNYEKQIQDSTNFKNEQNKPTYIFISEQNPFPRLYKNHRLHHMNQHRISEDLAQYVLDNQGQDPISKPSRAFQRAKYFFNHQGNPRMVYNQRMLSHFKRNHMLNQRRQIIANKRMFNYNQNHLYIPQYKNVNKTEQVKNNSLNLAKTLKFASNQTESYEKVNNKFRIKQINSKDIIIRNNEKINERSNDVPYWEHPEKNSRKHGNIHRQSHKVVPYWRLEERMAREHSKYPRIFHKNYFLIKPDDQN